MKRVVGAIVLLLTGATLLTGCVPKQPTGEDDLKVTMYFSFDEEGGSISETVGNKSYPINYVFENAEYKQDESAKRVNGVSGKALSFDGYSTYIEAQSPTEDVQALTVSLWVAPRAYATRTDGKLTGLVSSLTATGGFDLGMYNYGSFCFEAVTNKGSYKLWSNEQVIDLYHWNYITAVFDGAGKEMRLYKNGEKVASCTVSADTILAGDGTMRIGALKNAASVDSVFTANRYAGLMDELRIYTQAMTDEQVREAYSAYADLPTADIIEDVWLDAEILADDRYAPQYHLRVSQNWSNETYGFFYYNGYYHAFCQQNALGPYYTDGQRWGHFVSTDLVHWEELTPALIPEDNGIDNNSCFSGCAILMPNGQPKLFYTGVNYGQEYLNLISTATADDLTDPKLVNWNKSEKVIVSQGNLSTKDNFRDPFVYEENGTYFMLIGGTNAQTGGGAIYCYRATDDTLENWEYLGISYSGDSAKYAFLGNCYELPNLFRLTNRSGTISKYMLMFSPIGNVNGVYYLLGDFDTTTGAFIPDAQQPQRYDVGPTSQVLCPSGFYDTNTGRNLLITMSRTGLDAQERYDSGWATVMTLIKEIYLSDSGEVCFAPIEEYETLNRSTLIQTREKLTVEQANEILADVHGDMLRIELTIDPGEDEQVGAWVKYDADGAELVKVLYNTKTEYLSIDTSKSSLDMRNNGAGGGTVTLDGDRVRLTIFVDRAMVEAYLNEKNQVTAFGYNTAATANGIRLYSSGKTAVIEEMTVYELGSSGEYDVPAFWNETKGA